MTPIDRNVLIEPMCIYRQRIMMVLDVVGSPLSFQLVVCFSYSKRLDKFVF